MIVVITLAALIVILLTVLVGGVAAVPLALAAISIAASLFIGLRLIIRWFSGQPPVSG